MGQFVELNNKGRESALCYLIDEFCSHWSRAAWCQSRRVGGDGKTSQFINRRQKQRIVAGSADIGCAPRVADKKASQWGNLWGK